jgi:tetratricopeptide (TPR) repeat protein
VVTVLDKVAVDLRKQLGEPSQSVQRFSKPLFAGRSTSITALKAYADAGILTRMGRFTDAILLYQHAIAVDPKFVMAYADLGTLYLARGEQNLAAANLTKAYELRDIVDDKDRLFITAVYSDKVTGDLSASIRNYQSWSELYPGSVVPLGNLADLQTQIGKPTLAIQSARRAVELDPENATSYVILARAQMHMGQFDESVATCHAALNRHLDKPEIHGILFQIAYLRLDQPAIDEEIGWAKGKPAEQYIQSLQGQMDFALGKVKAAQAVFASLADSYRKQGQTERANRVLAELPRAEAELGLTDTANALLQRLPEISGSVNIPVAWAEAGEISRAEKLLEHEVDIHPTGTLWKDYNVPQVRAAIALNQKKPEDAIQVLQDAGPYDLRSFDAPAMRGRAYLAAKQPALAEAEFHKILDHSGIEPLSYNYALAQLGLARSLAQQQKAEEAGYAYNLVLQIWKDADPDLPRLKEAKAEYARLTGVPVKSASTPTSHSTGKPHRK